MLDEISQDEQKRLAYTARQMALYDSNQLAYENFTRGKAEGETIGFAKAKVELMERMRELGYPESEIAKILERIGTENAG